MRWDGRGDDVWLLVEPGDDAQIEDVVREFDAAGYVALDLEAVQEVLDTGEPRAVARLDERHRLGSVEVVVDREGFNATLIVTPAGSMAPPVTRVDVETALALAGVKLGIDHLLINSLPLHIAGQYLVASGWQPAPGRDGHVQYLIEPVHEFRPEARSDGGVDFHAVATIPDVRNGQLLAALVEPTEGTSGRTVRGDAVPGEPGTPATLPLGDNVTVSDDGCRLYAATNGLLEITGDRMSVRPQYVIDGDVGLETGSVSFSGDVIVRGSVRPGFRVIARGRVVVMGDVEDAEVRGETLVWVRGAAVGERCLVHSGGDLKVRTALRARLEARRNVYIEREAHEATILAGHDLVLEKLRNRISGGSAWVGRQVLAGEVGAVGGVDTRIQVGVDPFTAELLEGLTAEQAEHRQSLERVELAIAPFIGEPDAMAALPDDRRRAVERLIAVDASLRAHLVDLDRRIAALLPDPDDPRPRVVARLALRAGALIGVAGAVHRVRSTQHRVAATAIDGQVTFVPLGDEAVPSNPGVFA